MAVKYINMENILRRFAMVKRLTKPFAAALVALCLLFAAAAAGFIASFTVKALADDETTEPAEQTTQFHDAEDCPNKDDTLVITFIRSDGSKYSASMADEIDGYLYTDEVEFLKDELLFDTQGGDTVHINKCIHASDTIEIRSYEDVHNVTIDFEGHTISNSLTSSSSYILNVTNGNGGSTVDEWHFENGSLLNVETRGVNTGANTILYLKNMQMRTYNALTNRPAGSNGAVYFISGTYITSARAGAITLQDNNLNGTRIKDMYRYVTKDDIPLVFVCEGDYANFSKYQDSYFSNIKELPKGYIIDIDLDGRGFTVKKNDYAYFVGTKENDDGTTTDKKYTSFEDALKDGVTELRLNTSVPKTDIDENDKTIEHVYEVPEDVDFTLDLNICTFSAKIINNGNLTLTGPTSISGNGESVFDGILENTEDKGVTTAQPMFHLKGDATKYIGDNTINLDTAYIITYSETDYEIQAAKIAIGNDTYGSYTAAIKNGLRNITFEGDWLNSGSWYENITIDIGDSELTIDLNGKMLIGTGATNGLYMTLNIISGKVAITNGTIRAAKDNASFTAVNKARSYAIQNAGELTLENVVVEGGVYTANGNPLTQGAVIRNTGTFVMKGGQVYNQLFDLTEGVELGSGIYNESGSLELDNVYLFISAGYGVYACEDSTVKIYGGTHNNSPAGVQEPKTGALYAEDGANVELGVCDLYVSSQFDLSLYTDDYCVTKTAGTQNSNGNITIDHYVIGEHDWGEPDWKWNGNNKQLCDAEFTCAFGGEKITVPAKVTVNVPDGKTCDDGITITYTATVEFNGKTETYTVEVNTDGKHSLAIRTAQAPNTTTYSALEKLNTLGMRVLLYCAVCGKEVGSIAEYKIQYENGDCFHYGDKKVTISYKDADNDDAEYTCDVLVTVNQLEAEIKWQYSRDNESWAYIDENTVFNYDGKDWYIRAEYFSADESRGYINVEKLLNAGTFVRTVDANEYRDYAFNANDLQITLTVEPQKVNLSSKDTFGFELVFANGNPTELWNGPVYVYTAVGGKEYPSYTLLDTEYGQYQGYTFKETATAAYSVVRYRGSTLLTLGGKAGEQAKGQFTFVIDETSEYTANEIGVYTVKAILTATDNYAFESSFTSEIAARGLSFEISPDNKTAVVSKTWYVVQVDNYLIDADSEDEVDYDISDWTYGAGITISAPKLAVGNDDKTISYTLRSGSTTIAEDFHSDDFGYYINSSMFAGSYRLEATIPVMLVDGIVYNGATFVYEFEVEAVDIHLNMVPDSETGYGSYEWKYNAEHRDTFFSQFSHMLSTLDKEVLSFTHAEHEGYWKDLAESDQSYTGHTITYNFARMYNDTYYAANDNEILTKIEPGTNAT